MNDEVREVALRIRELSQAPKRVAIDGMTAAGKSTFATALAEHLVGSALIRGDDFGRPMEDNARLVFSPPQAYERDIDWQRIRTGSLGAAVSAHGGQLSEVRLGNLPAWRHRDSSSRRGGRHRFGGTV